METILIVDDDPEARSFIAQLLVMEGYQTLTAVDAAQTISHVKSRPLSLVLLDMVLPDLNGLEVLKIIKGITPKLPVIMITAYHDYDTCIKALSLGAYYYLPKPITADKLLPVCREALEKARLCWPELDPGCVHIKLSNNVQIITKDPQMKTILGRLQKIAAADVTVALQGETGSGKEVMARLIHERSARKDGPFVAVNCAAIPETLAESELFGYEKGAFSGATCSKPGYFECADGGILFLDEITSLPLIIQNKILRAIEEKEVTHLGDTNAIKMDARIISSTNARLDDEVRHGKFREDLFHRLNDFVIGIPPLRERKCDILILAEHFIGEFNIVYRKMIKGFSPEVKELFLNFSWPGNVRQLKKVILNVALLTESEYIIPGDLPEGLLQPLPDLDLTQFESLNEFPKLNDTIDKIKEKWIHRALELTKCNKSKAAKLLGINRRAIYRELQRLKCDK